MKAMLYFRVVAVLVLLAALAAAPLSAQEEYRRVSFTLNGGIAYASTNASGGGNQISPRGFFGSSIEPSLSVGGGLMFGIHPAYSIELNGQYISFDFTDAAKENRDLTYISFRNIVHMNQLVGFTLFTPRLAPYVTAVGGVNILDFDTDIGWHIAGGVGVSARLSNMIDFFMQYEMNLANGTTNPEPEDLPTFGNTTAGLRFHFGPSGSRHTSWRRPTRDLFEEDYQRIMAIDGRMDEVESATEQQNAAIEDIEERVNSRTQQLENRTRSLENRTAELEEELADMKQSVAEGGAVASGGQNQAQATGSGSTRSSSGQSGAQQGGQSGQNNDSTTSGSLPAASTSIVLRESQPAAEATGNYDEPLAINDLPEGHYIQLFASDSMASARRIRQDAINLLGGTLDNPADMVLITRRAEFYLVQIGLFNRFSTTANVLRMLQQDYEDAFILTFPRPEHQQDIY